MTSKVTVDAHAGWAIKVVLIEGEPDSANKRFISHVVEPNTEKHFYIHSGLRIVGIEEL